MLTRNRESKDRLIVGITGASGVIYGIRILQMLSDAGVLTHLIVSRSARMTIATETEFSLSDIEAMADVVYSNDDIGAACSSGSFRNMGMIVAPCTIKTMSEIASGVTANLISRSADVALKERRRVVLMLRETPLHIGHIRSMAAVTEAGAIVYPPVPAFYAKPESLEDMINHTVGRALDLFEIDSGSVKRWTGMKQNRAARISSE